MSQLTFNVNYATSFRKGVGCAVAQPITIEVDPATIPESGRAAIAAHLKADGRLYETQLCSYSDDVTTTNRLIESDTPELTSLLNAIRINDSVVAFQLAERLQKKVAVDAATKEATMAVLAARTTKSKKQGYKKTGEAYDYDVYAYADKVWPARPYPSDASITESPEAVAWAAELDAANADRRDAAIAAETERIDRERSERSQWVATYGSRRLQRMVAEGIDHEDTYQKERAKHERTILLAALAAERPGWSLLEGRAGDIKDVSERSLALLDAARVVAPNAKLAKFDGKVVAVEFWRGHTIYWPKD